MKRLLIPFALGLPMLLAPSQTLAADHYDMFEGNAVTGQEERHHDIVDLFAFPAPDNSGRLVMIMNTHNRAHPDSVFLDSIHYSFRLRTGVEREKGNEYRFTCTFDVPAEKKAQKATCQAYRIENKIATPVPNGSTVVEVGNKSGGSNPSLKAFAGLRADAFFGDAVGLELLVKQRRNTFTKDNHFPEDVRSPTFKTNDLAIVLEVDVKKLLGENGPIVRVAAETAKKKKNG